MKFKNNKKIKIVLPILFTSFVGISFLGFINFNDNKLVNQNLNENNNIIASNNTKSIRPLVPAEFTSRNSLITLKTGPLIAWKNTIYSIDWFGSIRWELDLGTYITDITTQNWWQRKWINWAYDKNTDLIYILGMASRNQKQNLVIIDALNGTVKKNFKINRNVGTDGTAVGLESYSLNILDSGNLMAFGSAKFVTSLTNPNTEATTVLDGNNGWNTLLKNQPYYSSVSGSNDRPVPSYVVPISNNVNLAVMSTLANSSTIFALVTDNMEPIYTNSSDYWSLSQKVINNTSKPSFRLNNGQYARLLNGNTVFISQDRMFVFNPSLITATNPGFAQYKFSENISSWSIDLNENIYLKFNNNTSIYRISSIGNIVDSFNGVEQSISNLGISTYYDMNGNANSTVANNSGLFQIYSLPEYSGSLMLISGIVENSPSANPTNPLGQYGLMLGIIANTNAVGQGDSPGLINTAESTINPADFDIQQNILDSKLPSEITQSDITILNDGFFTSNTTIASDSTLKYLPFLKSNVNDEAGTFSITVNLDQIPWFTSTLPSDAIPTTITKNFSTTQIITNRYNWKDISLDYNLANTLPSKVDLQSIIDFDPFVINLNSQTVVDQNTNNVLYPKKNYSISSANDATGIIEINVEYIYYPLNVQLVESNLLTYVTKKSYSIFNSSLPKSFQWIGGNNSTTDINTIPSLKYLSTANYLPSSIQNNDYKSLLSFIDQTNTKGYPLNKMSFNLTPNDSNGTLTITGTMPASYFGTVEVFSKTYSGFNRTNNYSFNYQLPNGLSNLSSSIITNPITTSKDYTQILPSNVTTLNIYEDFVKYTGYNPLDLKVLLTPNDVNGTLLITFELINTYPEILQTTNTFKLTGGKYISEIQIGGLFTESRYLSEYNLSFKDNVDTSLIDIKKLDPQTISDKLLSSSGLTISGVTYFNVNDLCSLFISSTGTKLPPIQNADVNMFTSSQNGTVIFQIIYNNIFDYPLIYTKEFTGFVKGVAIPTSDSFVFKSQSTLDQSLLNYKASDLKQLLLTNPIDEIQKYTTYIGGQFTSLIATSNFTLNIDANDIYGTLNINISFTGLINPLTLKDYSIQYTGFAKSN